MNESQIEEIKPLVEKIVLDFLKSNDIHEPNDIWFNLGEAATYIGVSRNTLKKFIESGGVKLHIANGIKRISKTQLDNFMRSKGV